MAKSRQSQEYAKAFVSPLFAWTNAILKGSEMMLDSMQAATKNAKDIRVAVLPDADAPRRTARKGNAKSGGTKAKSARRRRR
jgi:hypothetical protein